MIMMMSTWNDWVLALLRRFLRITTRKEWRIVAGVRIMRQTRSFTFIKSIVNWVCAKTADGLLSGEINTILGDVTGSFTHCGNIKRRCHGCRSPGVEISPFVYVCWQGHISRPTVWSRARPTTTEFCTRHYREMCKISLESAKYIRNKNNSKCHRWDLS